MKAGETIGNYRVTGSLGAGGMGQVWRATDSRLGRDAALKVLPEGFADDPERHARFEREAKVLAALNHPHIATLYGLEHLDGQHVLVMELVEGEDLAQRIARGPLPVAEAVAIALQIADALEAAHAHGIVHRDLKPANVKVRPDGTVKVLDFGLAKGFESSESGANLAFSPTVTSAATAAGVILGTAAYMSPEQARGKAVDRRADIWAFGVVLLEMLTGKQLFAGETVTDVLAAVLTREPDWSTLPAGVDPALRRVLGRCLEKEPKRRYHDIGDVRLDLAEPAPAAVAVSPAAESAAARRLSPLRLAPWLAAALALGGLGGWLAHRPADGGRRLHVSIPPPEGTGFHLASVDPGPAALSPDGRTLAFTVRTAAGTTLLHVRPLDAVSGRTLGGTEACQYPFWSSDSRSLGFFANGKLKRIEAAGGPVMTLADAPNGKGGSWGPAGDILYAPDATSPLFRVSASGGEPKPVTEVDRKAGENSHRHPRFLPGGRRFLYLSRRIAGQSEGNMVMVGSLDGGAPVQLLASPAAAVFARGQLLFLRDTTLMARPFDPARLRFDGDAVPVAENVTVLSGAAAGVFSAAESGDLVYQSGGGRSLASVELHTRGEASPRTVGEPAQFLGVRAAPEGRRAALTISDPRSGTDDIWILDIDRGLSSRFTTDPANDGWPVWSPDGRVVHFHSTRSGTWDLYRRRVDGLGDDELLLTSDKEKYPSDVTPDGKHLLYSVRNDATNGDLMLLPLTGNPEPRPLVVTRFAEWMGVVSPNGRWLAYFSDESGRFEVYVTSFPDPGRRWRVSREGGVYVSWTANGRELGYHQPTGKIVTVTVEEAGGELNFGKEEVVAETEQPHAGRNSFSFAPDGRRLIVLRPGEQPEALLHLVTHWPSLLPRS